MAITNYNELVTAVRNWSARTDIVDDRIEEFIDLTEAMMFNNRPAPPATGSLGGVFTQTDIDDTLTTTVDSDEVDLQSAFQFSQLVSVTIVDSGKRRPLQYVVPDQLNLWSESGKGKPSFYSIVDERIIFDKPADSTYQLVIWYFPLQAALDDPTPASNTILQKFPNCYLYGTLYHLSVYTKDPEEAQYYRNLYTEQAWQASKYFRNHERPRAPLFGRTDRRTP